MRQQELSEVHRQWLLGAVVKVSAERGVGSLTAEEIANRAGVSRRAFYALFEDSETCLLAALTQAVGWVGDAAIPVYRAGSSWRASIRAGLAAMLAFFDQEPALARLCVVDSLAAGPSIMRYRGQVQAQLIAEIDSVRERQRLKLDPPDVTAEGVVGAALHLLHTRLVTQRLAMTGPDSKRPSELNEPLSSLLNPMMSMIVLPYFGERVAAEELAMDVKAVQIEQLPQFTSPRMETFGDLKIRLTYRTMRVLRAVESSPGSSNLEIADVAGIQDPGQTSKLLNRLRGLGVVDNAAPAPSKGAPNVWRLTDQGEQLMRSVGKLGKGDDQREVDTKA